MRSCACCESCASAAAVGSNDAAGNESALAGLICVTRVEQLIYLDTCDGGKACPPKAEPCRIGVGHASRGG